MAEYQPAANAPINHQLSFYHYRGFGHPTSYLYSLGENMLSPHRETSVRSTSG